MTSRKKTSIITIILSLLVFFCATLFTIPNERVAALTGVDEKVDRTIFLESEYGTSNYDTSVKNAPNLTMGRAITLSGKLKSPTLSFYITHQGDYESKTLTMIRVEWYDENDTQIKYAIDQLDDCPNSIMEITRFDTKWRSITVEYVNLMWGKQYYAKIWLINPNGISRYFTTKKFTLKPIENEIKIETEGLQYTDGVNTNKYYSATPFSVKWGVEVNQQDMTSATVDGAKYGHGNKISNEGEHTVKLTNEFYAWEYLLVIDKTAPTLEVKNAVGVAVSDNGYFSGDLTVNVSDDNPFKSIEYGNKIIDYGDEKTTTSAEITVCREDFTGEELKITAKDLVGNTTVWTGKWFSLDEFENSKAIKNSYKVASWYNVKLPSNRYPSFTADKLNFSFETYDAALSFAKTMERQYQVEQSSSGVGAYATIDNYAHKMVYESDEELDAAITKWAKNYVSDKQVFSTKTNAYYNEPTSLVRNSFLTPSVVSTELSEYFLIKKSYTFTVDSVRKSLGLVHSVSVSYLGDVVGGELKNTGKAKTFTLSLGINTWAQHLETNDLQEEQGFYLIKESDNALNEKSYLVYYDLLAPTLTLTGKRGDADTTPIHSVDIATYDDERHFIEVEFNSMTDNKESSQNLIIKINGYGYDNALFNSTDDLPILCAENNTYGLYTVTVYDRSCNERQFEFYIAPTTTPNWTHTSLSNNERLKVTFSTNYRYNAITKLTIYRIAASGADNKIETDGDGTKIDFTTFEYVFYIGGKYQAEIVDAYARTVRTKVIFYKKGLPDGSLKGVTDGGATRRDVTFTCDEQFIVRLYIIDSGTREIADTSLYTMATQEGLKTLEILANEQSSHKYLIAVHNAANEEVFVEYTFEIDTICGEVTVYGAADDSVIVEGKVVTSGFYVKASEPNVTFTYYINEYNSGLNVKRYVPGNTLYADGTYHFTAKDYLGNTREFTVLVDATVTYAITGEYSTSKNGEILAKQALTFNALEKCNDIVIYRGTMIYNNGELLFEDGTYNVYAEDQYGNILHLVIKIDTTAPIITLDGVTNGSSTKENVTVTVEGGTCILTNSKGAFISNVESGQVFDADGDYYIKATDEVGNETAAKFFIRTRINVTANVLNKQVTTDAVEVSFGEDVTFTVKRDGEPIEPLYRYTEKGRYVFNAHDELGNTTTFEFEIIEKIYREYELVFPTGWNIINVWKDEQVIAAPLIYKETGEYIVTVSNGENIYELTFEIDATPPTVEIKIEPNQARVSKANEEVKSVVLFKDGNKVDYSLGATINESGSYRLEVTDALGNTNIYEFEVPFALNIWAIIAIIVGVIIVAVIAVFLIKSKKVKI